MKKSICILALLLFGGAIYAQNLMPFVPNSMDFQNQVVKRVPYPKSPVLHRGAHPEARTATLGERWYCYVEASQIVNSTSGLSDPFINYMFPDSTIQAQYSSTVGDPFIHGYALRLDPAAAVFGSTSLPDHGDLTILRSGTSTAGVYTYYLDSLIIPYYYQRPASMPSSVKDTVVLQIIPCSRYTTSGIPASTPMSGHGGGSVNSWATYFFSGASWLTNYGEDTIYFTSLGFNQNTWRIPASATQFRLYKIPLGQADTSDGGKSLQIAMNSYGYTSPYKIPAAKIGPDSSSKTVVIFMYYKPGTTWTSTDILDVNPANTTQSVFSPIYLEENGDETYPIYDGNTFASERPHAGFAKGYNISYMLPTQVRYKYSSGWGGYGIMIPHVAYVQEYAFEYPIWYAKLRSAGPFTSVNANIVDNTVILGLAYPNPARTEINIPYSVTQSKQVEITITNIMGQTVKSVSNQNVSAGQYVSTINVADLPAGMYFYTLKTDSGIYTNKFVVE
ncbi:MAG: T9SS type A sorting domain-containing protein [Bacteroidia bacterium]|nr:T9SS type A sorting domain-containing protein [Bacteroidia bacterium]